MPITTTAMPDYTNLLTTTLTKIQPGLFDNIFDSIPVLKKLLKGGAVKRGTTGESVSHLIEYARAPGTGTTKSSYGDYDVLDTTPYEFMTRAIFTPKTYARSIVISGTDLHKNQGPEAIVSLLGSKTENAMRSLKDDLSVDLFGDGTGNSSKVLTGLKAIVDISPTSGVVGAIDPSTYTWWANQYTTTVGSFAAGGLKAMRVAYNNCSIGGGKPDFIATTKAVHEYYEGSLVPQIQYSGGGGTAEGTFMELTFKGMPVIWDNDCASGYMYFINNDHLFFHVWKGRDFTTSKFVIPEDQDVQIAQVMFMGNLSTNNRRKNGVIAAITA